MTKVKKTKKNELEELKERVGRLEKVLEIQERLSLFDGFVDRSDTIDRVSDRVDDISSDMFQIAKALGLRKIQVNEDKKWKKSSIADRITRLFYHD